MSGMVTRRRWLAAAGAAAVSAGRDVARAQFGPLGMAVHSCRIRTEADTGGVRRLLRVEDGGWATAYFGGESLDPDAANVWLWDRNGNLRWAAAVFPPGYLRTLLWDAAARRNGDVAVVGSGFDAGGLAHFMCVIGSDGVMGDFLRTNPYSPRFVTFGPDNSIWTFGTDIDAENEKADHDLLAKYDDKGNPAKTFLPRSAFSTSLHPAANAGGGSTCLRSAAERIGLHVSRSHEWLEFDADGALLGRWPAEAESGKKFWEPAFAASGQLYSRQFDSAAVGLYRFDRASARWNSLPETMSERSRPAVGSLLGADGDRIVHYAGWPERGLIEWRDAPMESSAPAAIA